MIIGVVNGSKLVNDADVAWMVRACDLQIQKEFCKDWDLTPWPVIFYKKIEDLPNHEQVRPIVLSDGAGFFQELGYHSYLTFGNYIYGRVYIKTILDNGGGITGGGITGINISDVLSHEVLEMRLNPYLTDWVRGTARPEGSLYAKEACDAVQRDLYTVTPRLIWGKSKEVVVSSYVRPDYFSTKPTTKPAPYDRLGNLTAPFSVGAGGYLILKSDIGETVNVFGNIKPPAWMMAQKAERGARTLAMGRKL